MGGKKDFNLTLAAQANRAIRGIDPMTYYISMEGTALQYSRRMVDLGFLAFEQK